MLLGMHTYSLNLHGIGQAWADFKLPWDRVINTFDLFDMAVGWGLDGLHLDDGVLETLEPSYLREVRAAAEERGLYLEYNFSMDLGGFGIGIQHDIFEALETAVNLGADVVKASMDQPRPRPLAAGRFHPEVVERMTGVAEILKQAGPEAADRGIRIAIENHGDVFSEELLWMLDRVNHTHVGTCIDTVNSLMLTEEPIRAVENLAPRAFANHFRDNKIELERWGMKISGAPVGYGDLDMKRAYEIIRDKSAMTRINIETDVDIPLDNKETALRMEREIIEKSIRYCREVLGIEKTIR